MDDEKVIECVRQYPAIYDMSHPKYLDNNYKSSLSKKISEAMKKDILKWASTSSRTSLLRYLLCIVLPSIHVR